MRQIPILSAAILAVGLLTFGACSGDDDNTTLSTAASAAAHASASATKAAASATGVTALKNPTTTPSGLKYEDEVVGTGAAATNGKKVSVHYVGTLLNGTKFDSSRDRGQPFTFTLGQGQVIAGWDEGVAGMKVGGKRLLDIPANLAYGSRSPSPAIPPNSELLFEVELLGVQ
jgi:peptidylprolyl isomerase